MAASYFTGALWPAEAATGAHPLRRCMLLPDRPITTRMSLMLLLRRAAPHRQNDVSVAASRLTSGASDASGSSSHDETASDPGRRSRSDRCGRRRIHEADRQPRDARRRLPAQAARYNSRSPADQRNVYVAVAGRQHDVPDSGSELKMNRGCGTGIPDLDDPGVADHAVAERN